MEYINKILKHRDNLLADAYVMDLIDPNSSDYDIDFAEIWFSMKYEDKLVWVRIDRKRRLRSFI